MTLCHFFKKVAHQSPEYWRSIELRHDLLRKPLGLEFTKEELKAEQTDDHFAVFNQEQLIGCLVISPIDEQQVKIRQMAILESHQKQGVGKQLLHFAEDQIFIRGFTTIYLHAREEAVPFYQKQGYQVEGEPFRQVTIPHWKMIKNLKS
ncbi:MAG: N-acetyltransferase [Bacteroidetes bacterium SW_10_40_5]|nr:MAG: N-acetyltransferase [Bacteroidetes bacterium SW_10_40_5]